MSAISAQIAHAPPGAQAMTLDIAKFHRTCPIYPEHKPWFVLQGPSGFYVDHVCPFGCASSSSNAGMIANAGMDIWQCEGVGPLVKYEDDISVFRFPHPSTGTHLRFAYDRTSALNLLSPLQFPWHLDKGQDFATTFTYIGFSWDIEARRVSLPPTKREKFWTRTRAFIASFDRARCTLLDVMKIHGSLCHIAFVYPEGCLYLASLSNFISSFQQRTFTSRYPPRSVISDLSWWESTLSVPGISRTLLPRGSALDLSLYVDASTSWGIGIIFGGKWDAWRLIEGWRGPSRDIGWLEGIALELLIYILEEQCLSDVHLLIHLDNQGVIGAFDKGRSRNFEVNLSIRRSTPIVAARNILLSLTYIESVINPADPVSRGILGDPLDFLASSFKLPDELRPFLSHAQI